MRKESLEYLMSSAQAPQIVEEKIDEALRRIQEMDSAQWEANLVKRETTLGGQKVNPVKQDVNSVTQETNLKQQEMNFKQSEKENEHMTISGVCTPGQVFSPQERVDSGAGGIVEGTDPCGAEQSCDIGAQSELYADSTSILGGILGACAGGDSNHCGM